MSWAASYSTGVCRKGPHRLWIKKADPKAEYAWVWKAHDALQTHQHWVSSVEPAVRA